MIFHLREIWLQVAAISFNNLTKIVTTGESFSKNFLPIFKKLSIFPFLGGDDGMWGECEKWCKNVRHSTEA